MTPAALFFVAAVLVTSASAEDADFKEFMKKFQSKFEEAVEEGRKDGSIKTKAEADLLDTALNQFAQETIAKEKRASAMLMGSPEDVDADAQTKASVGQGSASASQAQVQKEQKKTAEDFGKHYAEMYGPGRLVVGTQGAATESQDDPAKAQKEQEKKAQDIGNYFGKMYGPGAGVQIQGQGQGQGSANGGPQSAAGCHTMKELEQWKATQLSTLSYVPEDYRSYPMANIESEYETNVARIEKETRDAAAAARETKAAATEKKASRSAPEAKTPEPEAEKDAASEPPSEDASPDASSWTKKEMLAAPVKFQFFSSSHLAPAVLGAAALTLAVLYVPRYTRAEEDPYSVYLMQP